MLKKSLLYLLENLYHLPKTSHFWIIEDSQNDNSLAHQISLTYQKIAQENYQGFSFFKFTNQKELADFLLQVKDGDFVAKCFDGRCMGVITSEEREKIGRINFYAAEHGRCEQITVSQLPVFLKSFIVDYEKMQKFGKRLSLKLSAASKIKIITGNNNILEYDAPLKEVLDYSGRAISGNIPTGEVFSEAQDLTKVNGQAQIIFNNKKFIIKIKDGQLVSHQGLEEFEELVKKIKFKNQTNKNLPIRELGFGVNKGANLKSGINQSIYSEKIFGTAHISLGPSHYRFQDDALKNNFPKLIGHHDLILNLKEIYLNDRCIFKDKKYLI